MTLNEWERKEDDNISDWDVTLMDGLEEEELPENKFEIDVVYQEEESPTPPITPPMPTIPQESVEKKKIIEEDNHLEEEINLPLSMEDSQSSDLEEPTQIISGPDDLYWEIDDNNPNQVIYDLENDVVIIPDEDEFMTTPIPTEQSIKNKIVSRNVGNSRRRRFR